MNFPHFTALLLLYASFLFHSSVYFLFLKEQHQSEFVLPLVTAILNAFWIGRNKLFITLLFILQFSRISLFGRLRLKLNPKLYISFVEIFKRRSSNLITFTYAQGCFYGGTRRIVVPEVPFQKDAIRNGVREHFFLALVQLTPHLRPNLGPTSSSRDLNTRPQSSSCPICFNHKQKT
jgi:hypothetical protein